MKPLANDAGRLAGIRARLAANRLASALFDTRVFSRHLKSAVTLRPRKPLEPRLPTMPLLFIGTIVMVMAGVHLLTLLH